MSNDRKFYKHKDFLKLKEKWYKKLEKANFEDIEQDEDNLHEWDYRFARQGADAFEYKQKYYTMATHYLHDGKFDTKVDRIIWEYHSEGISLTNISKLLKTVRIKMTRDSVCSVVKRTRANMYSLYKVTND